MDVDVGAGVWSETGSEPSDAGPSWTPVVSNKTEERSFSENSKRFRGAPALYSHTPCREDRVASKSSAGGTEKQPCASTSMRYSVSFKTSMNEKWRVKQVEFKGSALTWRHDRQPPGGHDGIYAFYVHI
jgi:hypothetical protein